MHFDTTSSLLLIIFLQNDHDPSKLLAETPCKLLRFLVADGAHVDADVPYAEVEVMKMCMPLLSPASGVIHVMMSEGQALQVIFIDLH
jgi:acetyl-CoA carboxylase / biotin carboxylase 1